MQESQTDLLTETELEISTQKRKLLLPWWVKVFMWIFLVFGAIVPFGLIAGILGYNAQLALYGLATNEPMSITGIIIILLFLSKGITAFGLLKEKDWAIKLGIIDAIVGITVCVLIMLYPFIYTDMKFTLRIELILLIPYLLKLLKIKSAWENTIEE